MYSEPASGQLVAKPLLDADHLDVQAFHSQEGSHGM